MFSQSFHVFRIATNCEDCTMNFRVQSFYATVHNFREAGYITNIGYRDTCFFNSTHSAAGGNNFYTVFVQETSQFYNAGFIRNAK